MNKLNKKQREFLRYIQKHHGCLGCNLTIPVVLRHGEYSEEDKIRMLAYIKKWPGMIIGKSFEQKDDIGRYGKPKKYLNIN